LAAKHAGKQYLIAESPEMSRNTAIDVASRESSCPWAEKKKKRKEKKRKEEAENAETSYRLRPSNTD